MRKVMIFFLLLVIGYIIIRILIPLYQFIRASAQLPEVHEDE